MANPGAMRLLTTLALVSALSLLSALPSGAQDGPLRLEPCVTSNPVLGLDGDSYSAAMPLNTLSFPSHTTVYTLDLSGQEVAEDEDMDPKASVSVSTTWDVVANDYDLDVNGNVSVGWQPFVAAEEFAMAGNVSHCGQVRVEVVNYLATGGDSVNVSVSVAL